MKQLVKNPGAVPRLLMLNDIAGFGRCSTTVSLPVISAMQVQVCPAPTSILSNHLGFPSCYIHDCTPYLREYLQGLERLQIVFDGFYCGFLGSLEQIAIVEELARSPMLKNALFLLDPVLGDHGRFYSTVTAERCRRLRNLLPYTHILTPNITEACLLTDTPYQEDGWTEPLLASICGRLAMEMSSSAMDTSSRRIVLTGLRQGESFQNFIWEDGVHSFCETAAAGASRPGTGDLFASILAADALLGVPFRDSVHKAAEFVALCIRGSEEADVPIQEGVLFERYLSRLTSNHRERNTQC